MARSREKVTVSPQPIGLAATFNPEALHKAAGMIADEGRAIGPSAPRCQLVRFRRVALEPGERRTLTFRLSTRDLAYVKRLERAIRRGDIVWNGVPYTVESEAMNRALFEGGLALSARLDKRYHRHTVAAKMTDVPGHTRSIIAPLARAGIRFLHVGVNPACTVPGVPPLLPLARPRGLRNRPRLPAGLRHRAHPEPHSLPRQRGRTLWPQLLHRLPRPARAASTST